VVMVINILEMCIHSNSLSLNDDAGGSTSEWLELAADCYVLFTALTTNSQSSTTIQTRGWIKFTGFH
jgi:hypothetical protein